MGLSKLGKPGHRSVATAGDVELSIKTKKKFVRSRKARKARKARCTKCGQTLVRKKAAALEHGGRIQRKRHRRLSSQISDLVETKRLYGKRTLERSHSTGKMLKAGASAPRLSSLDVQLDLMNTKKKLQNLSRRGLKG